MSSQDGIRQRLSEALISLVGTRVPRAAAPFFPDVLWRAPSPRRTAYLTFDDGPNPGCTERLLEVLDRHGAHGTFFLVGAKVGRHPDVVEMLLQAGHEVGNHTFTHPDAWRISTADVLREMAKTDAAIEEVTGDRVRWMRPPYGRFTRAMRRRCAERGQQLTMWDIGPGDYLEQISIDAIVRHVETHIRAGSIIVLHDNPRCIDQTPAAVDRLLERYTAEGWSFPPLPEVG